MITSNQEMDIPVELDSEWFDEHMLITREFTHVDSSEEDLHRLGYYWSAQAAAFPLIR